MKYRKLFFAAMAIFGLGWMPIELAKGDEGKRDGWQLSKNAKYEAHRIDNVVVVLAYGQHNSAGYLVRLRTRPQEVYPPIFELVHREPDGFAAQVITPYATLGHFKAGAPVKSVRVFDADGPHEIPVKIAR